MPSSTEASQLSARLRSWYRANKRDLPWRRDPSAYRVWVSEVMLQQTQVATVIDYFERWVRRFPSVRALAAAQEDDVLEVWQGLGYYARARALWRGARIVAEQHQGQVPDQVEDLLRLPGVGPYSAGAIASIAFGRPVPVVDGNVVRVLCRVFGLRGDPARAPLKAQIWEIARQQVEPSAAGEHNQALMELGANVCTPRAPVCLACPLASCCVARSKGLVDRLPELTKRPSATPVTMVAGIVRRRGRLLLVRPGEQSRWWAGLWQLPNGQVHSGESHDAAVRRVVRDVCSLELRATQSLGSERHAVTRFRIVLHAYAGLGPTGRLRPAAGTAAAWKSPHEVIQVGMPAPHRRLLERIIA
jgi:A/G-specific adenine glycosylase